MKKVIDNSALRSSQLWDFLSASRGNIAIIPDQVAIETFKDARTNLRQSLKTIAQFPDQVVVLKPTTAIIRLRPRKSGLHSRFTSDEETQGFRDYCRGLFSNIPDAQTSAYNWEQKHIRAKAISDRRLGSVEEIRASIQFLKDRYTQEDLKSLRRKQTPSAEFWRTFVDDIFNATIEFLRDMPEAAAPERSAEIVYSYPFRYTLCALARAVDWIAEGGYGTAPDKKLANDYTDMAYAAYATYYDGLLTQDKKLQEIYSFSNTILRRVLLKAADIYKA